MASDLTPLDNEPQKDESQPGASGRLQRLVCAWAAWVVIAGLVGFFLWLSSFAERPLEEKNAAGENLVFRVALVQGKYVVGAAQLPGPGSAMLYEQVKELNTGPVLNRLAYVTLAGELAGAEEALDQLADLNAKIEAAGGDESWSRPRERDALSRLYEDYRNEQWQAPSLSADDRRLLEKELKWFGELALAPAEVEDGQARSDVLEPATRTMAVVIVVVLAGLAIAAAGFFSFFVLLALALMGLLKSGVQDAGAPHGGVYVETFAVWMLTYTGMLFIGELLQFNRLAAGLVFMLASMAALAWPVVRGIPFSRVRSDIGLVWGRGGWLEPLWGVVCYVSTAPLLLIGMVLMYLTLFLTGSIPEAAGDELGPADLPSHPIVGWLADAGIAQWVQIGLLACVAAPLMEETMFRGLLYRHLRDWTAGWRIGASVLTSALVNSFVFAAIHPQGWMAIPPLMSLAVGFSLAREWRGSLIAPMTAHGLNNGLMMCALMLIL